MKMRWIKDRRPMRAIALVAAGAFVLAACGDNGETDDGEAAATDTQFLTMATGSTGGTYFPLGGAMQGVWNDHSDGSFRVSTQSSGASVENLRLLVAGEVQMIMAVNGVAADGVAGEGAFEEDGALEGVTFVGNIYGEVTQIVARADSGIESVEDMAGMRIAVGPPGSGTEVAARTILEAAGVDPDNDIEVFQDTFGDAADGLRDGRIDAAFAILALPAGSLEEVANAVDLNFISITGGLLDGLLDEDDTLSALSVEPGTYPGQDEEVTWTTNWATLYVLEDLDEDVVYEVTRILYEQNEEIANAHAVGAQIQLDTALDGRAGIPIHPGAERFYEEAGAL
jgi:uncharacterized protein